MNRTKAQPERTVKAQFKPPIPRQRSCDSTCVAAVAFEYRNNHNLGRNNKYALAIPCHNVEMEKTVLINGASIESFDDDITIRFSAPARRRKYRSGETANTCRGVLLEISRNAKSLYRKRSTKNQISSTRFNTQVQQFATRRILTKSSLIVLLGALANSGLGEELGTLKGSTLKSGESLSLLVVSVGLGLLLELRDELVGLVSDSLVVLLSLASLLGLTLSLISVMQDNPLVS